MAREKSITQVEIDSKGSSVKGKSMAEELNILKTQPYLKEHGRKTNYKVKQSTNMQIIRIKKLIFKTD